METNILAGIVATSVVFGIGAATPAVATADNQIVGIEQTVGDPTGTEIAYTVTKIVPSADPVAHPVEGQLYEATVMAKAIQGTVVPLVSFFTARAANGANYPALADVSNLSAAPLADGATTDGTIYFDVVGPVPTSVVYDNPPQAVLTWKEPIPGDPTAGGSTGHSSGGGSTGGGSTGGGSTGGGGSPGVTGSTGPNAASPNTSGGDIGGGQNGTEGGGGNLSSGGGSGAPTGNTGGHTGSGGGG